MTKSKLWLFGDSYVANKRPGTWIHKIAKQLNCTIEHIGEDSSSLEVAAWELHCCKNQIAHNDKVIFMFTQPHRMTFKGKHFSVPTLEAIDLGYKLPEGVKEDIAIWRKHYARFIDDTYLEHKKTIHEGFITYTLEELATDKVMELDFYGDLDFRGINHRQGISGIASAIYHSKGYSDADIRIQYESQQHCAVLNKATCWNHMGVPGSQWDIVDEVIEQVDLSALQDV